MANKICIDNNRGYIQNYINENMNDMKIEKV